MQAEVPTPMTPVPTLVPADTLHRFSVKSYDRMTRDGTLTDEDRVELLEGVVYDKMPHTAPHDSSLSRLHARLFRFLDPLGFVVRCQCAATFPTSMPEPDIAVVPGPESEYDEVRPAAADLLLVVEVSDTTLARDRGLKMRVYARGKVPVYWIVNLTDGLVEVYTNPRGGRSPAYRTRTDFHPGDSIPVVIGKKAVGTVAVSDILA
jgi:Putative restriction endonuclease